MSLVDDGLFVGCPCRFLVSHSDALGESQHIFHFNQIRAFFMDAYASKFFMLILAVRTFDFDLLKP